MRRAISTGRGAVTTRMRGALEIAGRLENILPVEVRIPGCPPDPETIAQHLVAMLTR